MMEVEKAWPETELDGEVYAMLVVWAVQEEQSMKQSAAQIVCEMLWDRLGKG